MKEVRINFKTTFDADSENSDAMTFYTEGTMKKDRNSFIYKYDETKILGSKTPVIGQLEVGDDFVSRSISGEESYVMNFREGVVERSLYHTPEGVFSTEVSTKSIKTNMVDGIGDIELEYYIKFGGSESVKNIINIRVDELE